MGYKATSTIEGDISVAHRALQSFGPDLRDTFIMFSRTLSSALSLLIAFTRITTVFSAPVEGDVLDNEARSILARATPAAPHFVVYSDKWVSGENGPPDPSQIDVSIVYSSTIF